MAVFSLLSRFALYQVMGEGTEGAMRFIAERLSDQSRLLVDALRDSNDRAWKAMEVALAGEGLWNKLDKAEDKAFRQQIRTLLDAMPLPVLTGRNEFRRKCLEELQAARKQGMLLSGSVQDATAPGSFARQGDQTALVEREKETLKEMSAVLDRAGHRNLAWLVGQEVQPGQALIVLAVRFFFRRAVETSPQLAAGIQFTRMENLTEAQAHGFRDLDAALRSHGQRMEEALGSLTAVVAEARDAAVQARDASAQARDASAQARDAVLDLQGEQRRHGDQLGEIYAMLRQLMEQSQMQQRREVRPGDSCSMRGSGERQRVREFVDHYRALPEEERRQRPALLNAVGMLQVAAGDTQEAQQHFEQVAALVGDNPKAKGQAHYNAYQAALEQRNFPAALLALREAVGLDAERYGPFPLHKYIPDRILGAGGFGVAFLCQHATLKRPVVVKALRLDGLERNVDDVFREAQVLNDLKHAAIIGLRDCDFADAGRTRPYLVMDYFHSVSLAGHVGEKGALSGQEMLPVARAVAEALKAAHAKGILHRDVKPDNLLVHWGPDEDDPSAHRWQVKLIDFGLAVKQEVEQATLRTPAAQAATPRDSEMAGTIEYAAPEQMGRLPGVQVGTYSDVYGFGKTCYFALLGTPEPDDGEKETLDEAWRKLLSQCTARKVETRLRDFAAVLERLKEVEQALAGKSPTPRAAAIPPAKPRPRPAPEPLPPPAAEIVPPLLELEPLPPPRSAKKTPTGVPPRHIAPEPPAPAPPPPPRSTGRRPIAGGLFGDQSAPPAAQDETTAEGQSQGATGSEPDTPDPGSKSRPGKWRQLGGAFSFGLPGEQEQPPAEDPPAEEDEPQKPRPPKKGKQGPLGGAFS